MTVVSKNSKPFSFVFLLYLSVAKLIVLFVFYFEVVLLCNIVDADVITWSYEEVI
jgi:hypothetical protein